MGLVYSFMSLIEKVPFISNNGHENASVQDNDHNLASLSRLESMASDMLEMVNEYMLNNNGYQEGLGGLDGQGVEAVHQVVEDLKGSELAVIDDSHDLLRQGRSAFDVLTTPLPVVALDVDQSKQQTSPMM